MLDFYSIVSSEKKENGTAAGLSAEGKLILIPRQDPS